MRLTAQGPGRARVDDQRRQRGDGAVRGGGPARAAPVPGPGDADRPAVPRRGLRRCSGVDLDPDDLDAVVAKLGPMATLIGATLRNTANPTMLDGRLQGQRHPGRRRRRTSTAGSCPAHEEEFFADDRRADRPGRPARDRPAPRHRARDRPSTGALVDAMPARRCRRRTRGARPVPYTLSGGTDAKAFARLGIRCFGFSPLRLPPDLDFAGMFHGVDERVPRRARWSSAPACSTASSTSA